MAREIALNVGAYVAGHWRELHRCFKGDKNLFKVACVKPLELELILPTYLQVVCFQSNIFEVERRKISVQLCVGRKLLY